LFHQALGFYYFLPICELERGILQGWVYVMDAFVEYYLHGGGTVVRMLLEAIGNQTDSPDACFKPQMSILFTV
jgi:hypothetical protein